MTETEPETGRRRRVAFAPGRPAVEYADASNTEAAAAYARAHVPPFGLSAETVFVDDDRGSLFEAWAKGPVLVPFGGRGGGHVVRRVEDDAAVWSMAVAWACSPRAAEMWPPRPWPEPDDWTAEFRFVVTGGRDYADRAGAFLAFDRVVSGAYRALGYPARWRPVPAHGAAHGADEMVDTWADGRQVAYDQVRRFPVKQSDYDRSGKRAPLERNTAMLETMRPHLVVALPGGSGTAHCVREARRLGYPVWRPYGARFPLAAPPPAAKAPSKGGARARG
jgi:hypothetical protein